jgi:hypothetical protein
MLHDSVHAISPITPSTLLEVDMISDRKRLLGIHAAAALLAWLWSGPALAQDTIASHIYPSPFGSRAAADPAPRQGNNDGNHDLVPKSVTDACESLRRLREQSGRYRDQLDCVAVPFPTTDLVSPKLGDWPPTTKADAFVKSSALDKNLIPQRDAPPAITKLPADQSTSYWSYFFDCKHKDKVKSVATFSSGTFVGSNLTTEESARLLVRSTGASDHLIAMASPRVVRVARSAPWKIGWAAVMLTSGMIELYQFMSCE